MFVCAGGVCVCRCEVCVCVSVGHCGRGVCDSVECTVYSQSLCVCV